jgi:hypothetical protein
MRKFRVSVDMVRCCDLYVNAASAEVAKRKVLDWRLWREENDDAWCDGHEGTEQVDECVAVDDNGNEI